MPVAVQSPEILSAGPLTPRLKEDLHSLFHGRSPALEMPTPTNRFRSIARALCPPVVWQTARQLLFPAPRPAPPSWLDQEEQRLQNLPRYLPGTTDLIAPGFQFNDGCALLQMYREVFTKETLKVPTTSAPVRIIDCGANVGVTVHYWKRLFRNSEVIAFEADPAIAELLRRNCSALEGVTVVNAAVWTGAGTLEFLSDGSVGGHLESLSKQSTASRRLTVNSVRLREYLTGPVEILKMDIEGAELDVLADCQDRLGFVQRLFVEYHSFVDRPQDLARFFGILESGGYRIHVHHEMPALQPFVTLPVVNGKDLRLNVFAFRDKA